MKGGQNLKLSNKHTGYENYIWLSSGIKLQVINGRTDKTRSMGPLKDFVGWTITLEIEENQHQYLLLIFDHIYEKGSPRWNH